MVQICECHFVDVATFIAFHNAPPHASTRNSRGCPVCVTPFCCKLTLQHFIGGNATELLDVVLHERAPDIPPETVCERVARII